MITPKTPASGMSNVPTPKPQASGRAHPPYPKPFTLEQSSKLLEGVLCYYVLDYGVDGISVLLEKKDGKWMVSFADWYGVNVDLIQNKTRLKNICAHFLAKKLGMLLEVMNLINLKTSMFYFAIQDDDEIILTDVMLNPMKLAGPGMVRDLFGKVFKTQEVLNIGPFSEETISTQGVKLVIKPSKFRTAFLDGLESPLFVRI